MVSYDFAGKTALVTGGTSGIGRATAVAFGGAGARVAVSVSEERRIGNEEVAAFSNRFAGKITNLTCGHTERSGFTSPTQC